MLSQKNIFVSIVFVVLVSISFSITTFYFKHSVFNDFKTRVIGSRIADAGKSAYFYKWQPGVDSLYLLDPHEKSAQIVNGNTVQPTVLLLLKEFNRLPLYKTTAIWFWLSYAVLFFIFYLFYKKYLSSFQNKNAILLLLSFSFLLIVGWQMHLLSGQIYIYYTLLAISSFYFYNSNKYISSGICAGILTALRFPALLLILPIIFFAKNKKFTSYFFISFFLLILLSISFYGVDIWIDYFKSMQLHSLENAGLIPEMEAKHFVYPNYIEGVRTFASSALTNHVSTIDADIFSVQKLLVYFGLPSNSFVLLFLFTVTMAFIFWFINYFNKGFYKNTTNLILLSALAFCIVDYFLPALRFNYNFVQFLIVISILIFYPFKTPTRSLLLLALGLILNIIKLKFVPECYSVGEVLCIVAVIQILIQNKNKNEIF